ncbi:hypothetical protein PUN28_013587 [Cardiocondyla obscurior]|uniref:Uncharacterized protein n=1 Tax=Cardiocondyla obscurior TaxID=286306 RepID=A0AAW2F643_9HYME
MREKKERERARKGEVEGHSNPPPSEITRVYLEKFANAIFFFFSLKSRPRDVFKILKNLILINNRAIYEKSTAIFIENTLSDKH